MLARKRAIFSFRGFEISIFTGTLFDYIGLMISRLSLPLMQKSKILKRLIEASTGAEISDF